MAWKSTNFISLPDLYLAYRKAKVDLFYEKVAAASIDFCEYEMNLKDNLDRLYNLLNSDFPDWMTDESIVGTFSFVPKKIKGCNSQDAFQPYFSDAEKSWNQFCKKCEDNKNKPEAEFRLIGQHSVDFHIISTLWILKVGQFYDACLGVESRGYRLRRFSEQDSHHTSETIPEINLNSSGTFQPYAHCFKKWRDDGISAIKKELEDKKSIIAITMDFKRFFHQIDSSIILDYDFLKLAKIRLSKDQRFFTQQLIDSLIFWADIVKKNLPEEKNIGIPVGLTASRIIANTSLIQFDRLVKNTLTPVYYGRYVDDIFLVLKDDGSIGKSSEEIWKYIKEKFNPFLENPINSDKEKLHEFTPTYRNNSKFQIAEEKQKLFFLTGEAGKDLINNIEEQIIETCSEWRMLADLPDDENKLLNNIFCTGHDSRIPVDNLRKADGVMIKRLSFAIVLRNFEAIAHDIQPKIWSKQRRTFFTFVKNHVLSIPGIFEFYDNLHRIVSLAIKCNDYQTANQILSLFYKRIKQLKSSSKIIPVPTAFDYFCKYSEKLFFIGIIKVLGDNEKLQNNINKTWKCLNKLGKQFSSMPELKKKNMAYQLWVRDLGYSAYRETIINKQFRNPSLTPLDLPEEIKGILRIDEVRNFIKELNNKKVNEWPLIFATRPFSISEISNLVPKVLIEKNLLIKYAEALRGVYISKKIINHYLVHQIMKKLQDTTEPPELIEIPLAKYPDKPLIALPCLLTEEKSWEASIRRKKDPDINRYFRINRLINNVLQNVNILSSINKKDKRTLNYVILPELSIHERWFDRIAYKLAKSGISIIAGIEYEHYNNGLVTNQAKASLITDFLGYKTPVVYTQEKEEPSIHEKEYLRTLAQLELKPKQVLNKNKPIIRHENLCFGILLCSELTDISFRKWFQGKVDSLFVLEWNPDIETFSTLIESSAFDVHCYMIQSNNRLYGDCRIRVPAKVDYERDSVRIKGGLDDYFVIGELDVNSLREFQLNPSIKKKKFKPVPTGFQMAEWRKR